MVAPLAVRMGHGAYSIICFERLDRGSEHRCNVFRPCMHQKNLRVSVPSLPSGFSPPVY